MKTHTIYICTLFLLVLVFASCDENEIMTFETERSGINFDEREGEYSFSSSKKIIDTVGIPFTINGITADYVRNASFTVLVDSTTALETEYKIISAIVEKDSIGGLLKIMVTKNDLDSIPDRRLWLKTAEGGDFEPGIYTTQNHILTLTDKFPRPKNWGNSGYLPYYLGAYSRSYYEWIIATTGETQFPYPRAIPGYNDGKAWHWTYIPLFRDYLKDQLKKYNASIAPDFLIHSDGALEGEPVQVAVYR